MLPVFLFIIKKHKIASPLFLTIFASLLQTTTDHCAPVHTKNPFATDSTDCCEASSLLPYYNLLLLKKLLFFLKTPNTCIPYHPHSIDHGVAIYYLIF